MASITVDIQAKVVGYEASLKAMKDAFSKIDPGSDIGKSLEKAIKYAEGQLKNLSKNLTPKATSDTQIDSIVEKTNRAGEAIQEVTRLMQKVSVGDIDFSSFENGIGKLMGTLRDLETELDSRISNGLRETITSSTELTDAFSKLDIDVKGKSAGEIFEAISEKAKKAASDTEDAQTKLEAAEKNLSSQQGKLNKIESNPIYNKDTLEQDLQNLAVEYTKTFDDIKAKIQEGLRGLLGSDSTQADELMKNFMNGLNPQTLKDHLMQLKNALQQELTQNNSAKDIYSALLGDDGSGGNAQAIATKLLSGLNQSLPQVKEELQSKVQEFISSLTNKEAGQITTLINLGDIENAVKTTIQAIERAYASIKGAAAKQRAEVLRAMEGKETAQTDFNTTQQNQQYIDGIQAQLQERITQLEEANQKLQEQIDQLTKEIQEKKDTEAGNIHKTATESDKKVSNLKIAGDEARMYRTELQQVQAKEKLIGKIEGVVQRWFSIYAAVRMVGNAIRSVISTVQELDKTITEIAIVTNMTQDDLWGQMKSYTDMARQYAASISGVYKVSQLYYQQGLQQADVMALTEQTLKMARISGLDYAEATDYMTNAVRSFKIEMTDAQRVVDVYSAIAASSATSTSELASAMSKTASSAAAVGSSFENTTAMMAVMIEATREAPENIGSALKSIISRYGEMKADPTKLIDSEGQEMSLNKVDKALQSVGISIQDANHQFRDFDDVITELAEKWDTIDTNTQRYIATVMAGNRQQSRFLALVSNGERLAELSEEAANSEDTATLQVLKTMDSIEAKTQQLKTSLQSLYVDAGIEKMYKGLLDFGAAVIKTFTNFAQEMGTPFAAVAKFGLQFASLANLVTTVFGLIKAKTQAQIAALNGQEKNAAAERVTIAQQEVAQKEILMIQEQIAKEKSTEYETEDERAKSQERIRIWEEELAAKQGIANAPIGAPGSKNTKGISKNMARAGMVANLAGSALSLGAASIGEKTQPDRTTKAWMTGAGSTLQGAGMGASFGPWGMAIGAALGAIVGGLEAVGIATESTSEKISNFKTELESTNNTKLEAKNDLKTLTDYKKRFEELSKAQYDNAEARQEYIKLSNEIAELYPTLISGMDAEGNYIIDLTHNYDALYKSKKKAYDNAFVESGMAQIEAYSDNDMLLDLLGYKPAAEYISPGDINPFNSGIFQQDRLLGDLGHYYEDLTSYDWQQDWATLLQNGFEAAGSDRYNSAYYKNIFGFDPAKATLGGYQFQGGDYRSFLQDHELSLNGFDSENYTTNLESWYKNVYSQIINYVGQQLDNNVDLDAINDELKTYFPDFEFSPELIGSMLELKSNIDYREDYLNQIIKSLNIQQANSIFEDLDIETSITQRAQATQALQTAWEDFRDSEEVQSKLADGTLTYAQAWQQFLLGSEQIVEDAVTQFAGYNQLSKKEQHKIDDAYTDIGRYHRDQLRDIIPDMDEELLTLLQDHWDEVNESILVQFTNKMADLGLANIGQHFAKNIPPKFLQSIQDIYSSIYDNDSLSEAQKKIQSAKFTNILSLIDSIEDEDKRSQALTALSEADFTSLTGIYNFLDVLEEIGLNLDEGPLKQRILEFGNGLVTNLTTEFETFTQSIISDSEEFNKALSNAQKGMDLKTASEMANKLKLSLKDFRFEGGKYFYDNAQELQKAYLNYNEELRNKLESDADNLTTLFSRQFYWADDTHDNKEKQSILDLMAESTNKDWLGESLDARIAYIQELTGLEKDEAKEVVNYYDRYIKAWEQSGKKVSFGQFVIDEIQNGRDNAEEALDNYAKYQANAFLIQNGQIQDFLASVIGEGDHTQLISEIMSGNFTNLDESAKPYISELWSYVQNAQKNVFDQAIASVKGGKQLIEKNPKNEDFLKTYGDEAGDGIHYWLNLSAENLNGLQQDILTAVENGSITEEEGKDFLKKIHDIDFEDNIYNALSGIVDSYDSFSYEAGQSLAQALEGYGLEDVDTMFSTDAAGNLVASYDDLLKWLNTSGLDKTSKQYNDLRAKLEAHQRELSTDKILTDIIQNRDKLNEENVAALATLLELPYDTVIKMLHPNANGTFSLNLATLIQDLRIKGIELSDAIVDLLSDQIDEIISSITGLAGSQSKGFTDLSSMQKYVTSLREKEVTINGEEASLDNLFEYNESLRAYQFTTNGIIANIIGNKDEIDKLRAQLMRTKNSDEKARLQEQIDVAQTFIENSVKEFADAIDISAYLNTDFGSAASAQAMSNIVQAIANYNAALEALGKDTILNIDAIVDALGQGGQAAVIAAQTIADIQGTTLSAEEIESLYRREVASLVNAIDGVVAQPGEIVDAVTAQIIGFSNVQQIGNSGQYVVKTAANLYEAYDNLLKKMAATGEATLADLNKVAGLALDNKDSQQIAIDALGDAANLTYSRLGEIFTSANKLMTEELVQDWTDKGLIKSLGGNKIQITDFAKFADLMGFDTGSSEYISAFKTYNESLIDMNRKAEKNILEEAQNLGDMKAGDWIDLTQLGSILENTVIDSITELTDNGVKIVDINALDQLNNNLNKYGAYLENGILKTVDGANIPAIIQEIANNVQQYGNLSEAELAQLADTLKEILKSYADLISGAIEGSLSNEGAQQLQQWAESVGLGKLNFQETREGLRLSTEQAYKLYQEIAKIDGLQGQIVFDNLAESLRADKGGDFSSATKTLAAVPRIQAEIKANLADQQVLTDKLASNSATEADKARLKVLGHQEESLKRQKALYQSIAQEMAWSNMDNPDSYNFMNQSLPDVFQGPINYWNSVGEAFGAMNEAGKTGKMDIQDFYNIVGEMSNLAAATGSTIEFMGQSINGDLENAANLIEKGFNSLSNVDGKGVKVDMAKLAANLDTGATDMGKGFDSAVNKMASAQVHMLDAMIKVLETIVAMEKLGEVDVDNNGLLSVGEIFDGENFTPLFDGVREYLLNSEALEPLLDDLRVHGITLRELLDSNQDAWRNAGISEQEYANIMSAFYQAALSDNYDLDSLVSSVMNVLGGTGQVFSYYDKESGVETIIDMNGRTYSIDWNEEEDKKKIYDAFEKAGYDPKTITDEEIREILQQGQAGELTGEALIAYEISYGIISKYTVTDEDGSETIIWEDSYGNTYENEKDAVIGNALAKQQNQAEATSGITEVKMGANDAKRQSFQVSGGLSYNLTVDVDGKEIYSTTASDGSLVTAKTYPEMINALLNKESLIETGGHLGLDQRSEEDILRLRRKFGVEVTPDIIFRDSSGQEFNPENDPNIKTQLGQFLNRSHEFIEKSLEHTDSGTYVATLFDGSQLEVKAKDTDEAIAKLQTVLDPITASISTAITNAFTNSDTGVSEAIGNAVASAITELNFTEDQTPEIPEISATVTNVKITSIGGATYEAGEENVIPPNIDSLNATVNSLKLDATDIDVDSVGEQIQEALADLEITVPIKTPTPAGNTNNGNQQEQPESGSSTMTMNVVVNDEASSKIDEIQEKASSPVNMPINADADGSAANKIEQLNQKAGSSVSKTVDVVAELTQQYNTTIAQATKPEDKIINIKTNGSVDTGPGPKAGNVALAKGMTGAALARGRTLMGELGPELVVSKGRYFVVGQNGPEMVNLDSDAIVFNHLQTRQLLANGRTGTHATPVTNERKATSLATGNANGPAMASASAALAALKQLRAMWQSLADASLKDLGGMPGGSGGGGGGGGGNDPKTVKSVTEQVERWYNWIKEIESLQENINKLTKEYNLLEKQGLSTENKLVNLQAQYEKRRQSQITRSRYADEQRKYRTSEIERANKGLMGAFYYADPETGRVYLANDDQKNAYFANFLKTKEGQKANGKLASVMRSNGTIAKGTKLNYKDVYSQSDADADTEKEYQKWLTTKKGKKASATVKKNKKKKIQAKYNKKKGSKINKTLTTEFDIRTGADFMNELQRKNDVGENVHNAREQWELIQAMGFDDLLPQIKAGIDTSQEGWQEQAVENFYNAIDADKEAIESLTESIEEQEQAALEDAIAMQEINDQIRELAKPIPGVTEALEEWYNELKRIEAVEEKINILSKKNNNLQNDHIANGKAIFENEMEQVKQLQKQQKLNDDLYNKQVKERNNLVKKYKDLPINYDATTGVATFSEQKYNKTVNASYANTKKNSLGYEVDEQGRYVDNKGILRDANGKELNSKTEMFGQVQTTTINSTYNTAGRTLPEILKDITSQDATGKTAYNAQQQYNILKSLGLEKFLKYDDSGKPIYDDFGELTKEEMKSAVEAGISRIQKSADAINDATSEINKTEEKGLDIQASLYEKQQVLIDKAIELENLVKDAIVQERQNVIDDRKELKDVLDKVTNKTIEGLKDNLEQEKKLFDSDKDNKELSVLQAQLAMLRSSGGSLAKIRDVENQIQDKQQEMYFTERENAIEDLEDTAKQQIEALETQIDIMQTSLDYQVEHGLIWAEVNRKISETGPESLAGFIINNQKDFLGKPPTEQAQELIRIIEVAQQDIARRNAGISTDKLPKFAKGGKINFTGPAQVDGTKNKPEQIFNFNQMERLKEMFLDNLATTQAGISGLASITSNLPNVNAYNSINNEDNGINIEQLEFHMEVKEISNDYDARRAGREAMEEMVRIARKTGNLSISRR